MNTVVLCMDKPTEPSGSEDQTITTLNDFFLFFYVCECILKVIAMGFIFNKGGYIRDRKNISKNISKLSKKFY